LNGLKIEFVAEIETESAISYNSLIEISDFLPEENLYDDSAAVVACALKSCEIRLMIFVPGQ
jgi:hypothetical protein